MKIKTYQIESNESLERNHHFRIACLKETIFSIDITVRVIWHIYLIFYHLNDLEHTISSKRS